MIEGLADPAAHDIAGASRDEPIVAGIELGGTKAIAVVGRGDEIFDTIHVPTTSPTATLAALETRLRLWGEAWHPRALGIASFGPVALHVDDPGYGRVLRTPKPGWGGADIVGPLSAALPGPCLFHTDVTAAALAEGRWGAARGLSDFLYVTIGTGIGMGIVANGQPITGRMHPEAGHLLVRRVAGDGFAGVCPFHGDCLEGLASGPAIAARCGAAAATLAPDDAAWPLIADAIAEAFAMLMLTLGPSAIVIGGGVGLGQPQLLPLVRRLLVPKLGGYLPFVDEAALDAMIVPAALRDRAGPLGAMRLAQMALAGA